MPSPPERLASFSNSRFSALALNSGFSMAWRFNAAADSNACLTPNQANTTTFNNNISVNSTPITATAPVIETRVSERHSDHPQDPAEPQCGALDLAHFRVASVGADHPAISFATRHESSP